VTLAFVVGGSVISFWGGAVTSPFTLCISGNAEVFPAVSVIEGTICRTGSGSSKLGFNSGRGTGCDTNAPSTSEGPNSFVIGTAEIREGL
jgi:hypothetical protein